MMKIWYSRQLHPLGTTILSMTVEIDELIILINVVCIDMANIVLSDTYNTSSSRLVLIIMIDIFAHTIRWCHKCSSHVLNIAIYGVPLKYVVPISSQISSPSKSPHPYGISFGSIQCLTSWGLARLSISRSCIRFIDTRSLKHHFWKLIMFAFQSYLMQISIENINVNKLAPTKQGPIIVKKIIENEIKIIEKKLPIMMRGLIKWCCSW